jgi:hypothetical protein
VNSVPTPEKIPEMSVSQTCSAWLSKVLPSQLVDALRELMMMEHAAFVELTKFKIHPIQEDV